MDIVILAAAFVFLVWFVWWSTNLKSWNLRALCGFAALISVSIASAWFGSILGRYFENNSFGGAHGPHATFSRVFALIDEDLKQGDYQRVKRRVTILADGWKEVSIFSRDIEKETSYVALARRIEAVEKEPNQSPQRNAGSRPSSGDPLVFETLSSLGPRG